MTLGNHVSFPLKKPLKPDKARFVYQWRYAKSPSASQNVYHIDLNPTKHVPDQNEDL